MIYKIEIFNVTFWIETRNNQERQAVETWWHYFIHNENMHRVSVILAFLKSYNLDFCYSWHWCRRLSVSNNIRAYFGFRKQIKEFDS